MNITATALIEAVRQIAAENPDKVYRSPNGDACLYVHQDDKGEYTQPGCLIGQALLEIGVPLEIVLQGNPEDMGGDNGPCVVGLRLDGAWRFIETTPEQRNWLREVQAQQDGLRSWGEAVRRADHLATIGAF